MKHEGFAYEVSARLSVTKAEIDALVKLSGYHHDAACVAAGLPVGAQHPKVGAARGNGFLVAAMLLCDDAGIVEVVWPFRHLDTALKILEIRGGVKTTVKERILLDVLDAKARAACDAINKEHERLERRRS